MIPIRVLSRRGCHLCDEALNTIRHIQADAAIEITVVDIDEAPDLRRRYGDEVPVVLVDNFEVFRGVIEDRQLRSAIKRARWRRPISRILSRLRSTLSTIRRG